MSGGSEEAEWSERESAWTEQRRLVCVEVTESSTSELQSISEPKTEQPSVGHFIHTAIPRSSTEECEWSEGESSPTNERHDNLGRIETGSSAEAFWTAALVKRTQCFRNCFLAHLSILCVICIAHRTKG